MPELPDLTVFAENLSGQVAGKPIAGVQFRGAGGDEGLAEALTGARIDAVERAGKEICFRISNGKGLYVHLMLTGGFTVTSAAAQVRFALFSLEFADGTALVVTDPKGWAKISLNGARDTAVDALEVTADHLRQLFARKPRMLIKALLIDQKLIRGIGNAYADEILWQARISPKSVAGKIPTPALSSLAAAIPAVLRQATETLRRNHPGIIAGEFREFLAVHNPDRRTSPTGAPIIREQVASKTTYYTGEQELYA